MNDRNLEVAIMNARAFLLRANALQGRIDRMATGNAETGALRRSSMDLTRSLAQLRKSDG